jgi:lipopolysaccharide biosynthesis glycosyltransferase
LPELIRLCTGFDQREAVAFHTFYQSVMEKSSSPVQFMPLAISTLKDYQETHSDGSNAFTYSRFLTPYLHNFEGWVIFADGDMVCLADITELWNLRDPSKAVQVVQHDYATKQTVKYFDQPNVNYPRKNWSSVILWNCSHPAHRVLTPTFVSGSSGAFLHRFSWLTDDQIGALPMEWNWLAIEYEPNPNAKLVHYTLGTPCFKKYAQTSMSEHWWATYQNLKQGLEVEGVVPPTQPIAAQKAKP